MVKYLTVNVPKNFNIEKKFIHKIVLMLKEEFKFELEAMQINFVDTKEIIRLNKQYLNHNYSTDIITFKYSTSNKNLNSEIYISIDDAASNAKKYRVSFKEEIIRLVIHGFLHLLGHDDQSKKNKFFMKKTENRLLNKFRLIIN